MAAAAPPADNAADAAAAGGDHLPPPAPVRAQAQEPARIKVPPEVAAEFAKIPTPEELSLRLAAIDNDLDDLRRRQVLKRKQAQRRLTSLRARPDYDELSEVLDPEVNRLVDTLEALAAQVQRLERLRARFAYVQRQSFPRLRWPRELRPPAPEAFRLELFDEEFCLTHFRFRRAHLQELVRTLELPDRLTVDGARVSGLEGLCLVLFELTQGATRLHQLWRRFGRSPAACVRIWTQLVDWIYRRWVHLTRFDIHRERFVARMEAWAEAARRVTEAWGPVMLIHPTTFPICQSRFPELSEAHRDVFYDRGNGCFAVAVQGYSTPDGLTYMDRVYPGDVSSFTMYRMNHAEDRFRELRDACVAEAETPAQAERLERLKMICLESFSISDVCSRLYRGHGLTEKQERLNASINRAKSAIEHTFGGLRAEFPMLTDPAHLKLSSAEDASIVGIVKVLAVGVILYNSGTILRRHNPTSLLFGVAPPMTLKDYYVAAPEWWRVPE